MKQPGVFESIEPMLREASDALRRYREAQACGAPPEEVERLRVVAESLFRGVAEYQSNSLRGSGPIMH